MIEPKIFYYIVLPADDHQNVTPFQGFSFALTEKYGKLRFLAEMPSHIYEPMYPHVGSLLSGRISGANSMWWMPLMIDSLVQLPVNLHRPFQVVLADNDVDTMALRRWCDSKAWSPLLVSPTNGHITPKQLNRDALRTHFSKIVRLNKWFLSNKDYTSTLNILNQWQSKDIIAPPFEIRGNHFTLMPNYMTLEAVGYDINDNHSWIVTNQENDIYVKGILETANAVLDLREYISEKQVFRSSPPMPDLFLFAPSMLKAWSTEIPNMPESLDRRKLYRAFRLLQKQNSYNHTITEEDSELLFGATAPSQEFSLIMGVRTQEIALNSAAIGLKAASTISSVIRLPNAINRVSGEIKQFASHVRSNNRRPKKRAICFERVQNRLQEAFPNDYMDIVRRSHDGIKIISDIPLEWLPFEGLPLGIQKNVSRIPVTPGNLQISQLARSKQRHLELSDIKDILICSALSPEDEIRGLFKAAFETMGPLLKDINLHFVEVRSRDDLISALNNFKGAMMIFDGHGSHDAGEKPGRLWLHGKPIDIWELRNEVEHVPPIVFLSACDTYAADRASNTVASGFLNLGATTVIGSYFPLNAKDAAIFVARLLFRIVAYVPAITERVNGRAVRWLEVISGMQRMQLLSDLMSNIIRAGLLEKNKAIEMHKNYNIILNASPYDATESFKEIRQNLIDVGGIPESVLENIFRQTIACSSAISYVQLGNPELILFTNPNFYKDGVV